MKTLLIAVNTVAILLFCWLACIDSTFGTVRSSRRYSDFARSIGIDDQKVEAYLTSKGVPPTGNPYWRAASWLRASRVGLSSIAAVVAFGINIAILVRQRDKLR